ncbi:molybdopterin-synthase adenylyltransferase MoeB [Cohaesibacter celericrescens]|uniref:Molybdopterin-synthase adenylyltransferase n=1 Tax=Cohaesibacter celericrescens TaxID=2067669 RepID=A0A2N5XNV2_9HYPH|nr:molybdopterin-synthase adenylyltransferase MoeB [Cohaesibacter celericrescens]PLW76184.1 thiamine biosynthesis protein ThiF [Cohaesibacter celericrescens]
MLSDQELERYARHILLRDVGGLGQQKLKAARVLIIGAGGLGSPLLAYLAAAGVGTLGVVDDDVVSLSNLQRQIIHDSDAIEQPKVASARHSLKRINPHVTVHAHQIRLDAANGAAIVADYDLVVDGSDNFDTRYLVADLCEQAEKPLITAAVGLFDGSITMLKPYEVNDKGQLNPRYRDLFPHKPTPGSIPSCAEAGILGALTGVIGSMQAVEVIKEIVGLGEGLVGRLVLYDARAARFETIKYRRRHDKD